MGNSQLHFWVNEVITWRLVAIFVARGFTWLVWEWGELQEGAQVGLQTHNLCTAVGYFQYELYTKRLVCSDLQHCGERGSVWYLSPRAGLESPTQLHPFHHLFWVREVKPAP